jgi:hypothetical protein
MDARSKIAIVMVVLAVAGAVPAGGSSFAASKVHPFRLDIEFTADQVTISSHEKESWSVGYSTSANSSRVFYVAPGRVATSLQGFNALPYSFVVEIVDSGIKLNAIAGTNWQSLEYNCGGSSPCRVVVTEGGIVGQ